MAGTKRKKKATKAPEDANIPISSMIDIVFLLIIFFVVTAAINKEDKDEMITMAGAPHAKPVEKENPMSLIINIRKERDPSSGLIMHIGGRFMTKSQISNVLKKHYKEEGEGGDAPIIIRADGNTYHQYVKRAMEAITDTGLYKTKINAAVKKGNKTEK